MPKLPSINIDQESVPPQVLQKILRDPGLMEQLGDRVYELLLSELRQQRERLHGYGRNL